MVTFLVRQELYKGKISSEAMRLSELYKQIRHSFRKDRETGLYLRLVTVYVAGVGLATIVFARGYQEPDGHKDKWVAFLSTDLSLSSSKIMKKYANRWSIEVFFKESKQLLALGKVV
jgi:IS4 transposase